MKIFEVLCPGIMFPRLCYYNEKPRNILRIQHFSCQRQILGAFAMDFSYKTYNTQAQLLV